MTERETAKGTATAKPAKPAKMVLEDDFYCRARRRRVTYGKCLDDYVDANAFNQKKSACWRCLQGRDHRQQYANG